MSATLTTLTRFIALFHCNDFLLPLSTKDNFCSEKIFQNFEGKCVKNVVEPRYDDMPREQ